MPDDLLLDSLKSKDESQYQRDGSIARFRVYTFWLGKQGPFTERVPLEPTFDELEINRRIDAIRNHIRQVR